MAADQFAERLAHVRARFAAKLRDRIAALDASLPSLSGHDATALDTLAIVHRSIHDLCGIGPTIGFAATGQAARQVEQILLKPLRAGRALTDDETSSLRSGIAVLREAATADLTANDMSPE
jgi:hypothetical protein